jgi:hypothetical protein
LEIRSLNTIEAETDKKREREGNSIFGLRIIDNWKVQQGSSKRDWN